KAQNVADYRESDGLVAKEVIAYQFLEHVIGHSLGSARENNVFANRRLKGGSDAIDIAFLVHLKLEFFARGDAVVLLWNLKDVVVIVLERIRAEFVEAQLEGIAL